MGKREEVKKPRQSRDWYGTKDIAAATALLPHVWRDSGPLRYIEPCAGDGSLIDLMHLAGLPVVCVAAYDIAPQRADITQRNCLFLSDLDCAGVDEFITNPPYQWDMLQPILECLPRLLPTWLLLPADMMHNKRMSPYMDICSDVQSIGRLWWFENEKGKRIKGVDNFCWYKFNHKHEGFTKFHARQLT